MYNTFSEITFEPVRGISAFRESRNVEERSYQYIDL